VQISCKILVDQPLPQGFSLKKAFEGKALRTRLLVDTWQSTIEGWEESKGRGVTGVNAGTWR